MAELRLIFKQYRMKYYNIPLLMLLTFGAVAQPSINFDIQQSIGHEWGLGLVEDLPLSSFPTPLAGENLVWDFTFLGDMDNGFGVPFSQAILSDFLLSAFKSIEGWPLDMGGTAQDSFPTAVGVIVEGNDPNEYDGVFTIGQNDDGVVRLGELQDDGSGTYELDEQDSFLLYPTGLAYGESKEEVRLSWGIGSSTIDSLTYIDTFTFVGYGTAKMYYGDVDNVVLIRQTTKEHFWSHSLATGALIFEYYNYKSSYLFLQNGNMLPLLIYSFYTEPDWSPSPFDNKSLAVYVPFFQVINGIEENKGAYFNLSASPNPVHGDKVVVSYSLEEILPTKIELFTVAGQKLMESSAAVRETGAHAEELLLPSSLPTGCYYVRLTAGPHTGIEKISIINN